MFPRYTRAEISKLRAACPNAVDARYVHMIHFSVSFLSSQRLSHTAAYMYLQLPSSAIARSSLPACC
jgi:hypothetical protein